MTRSCAQLIAWAHAQPYAALLSITTDEARQFLTKHIRGWDGWPMNDCPATLVGRVCIISDLPPHHYLSTDGKVLPL